MSASGFVQGDAPHACAASQHVQPCTPPAVLTRPDLTQQQEFMSHRALLAVAHRALLANQDFVGVPGTDVAQRLQASSPPPPPAPKQPCKPTPSYLLRRPAMTTAQPMARGVAWVVPTPPAPKQQALVGAAQQAIAKQQQVGKHPGIVPPPAPPPRRREVPAPPSSSYASEPQPKKKARGPMGWPESARLGRAPWCAGANLG